MNVDHEVRLAFLGGGNMAAALVGGLVERGVRSGSITVAEIDAAARERLRQRLGVVAVERLPAGEGFDAVVLAVKPQQLREAVAASAQALSGALLVSIAAGVRTGHIAGWPGGHARVVRAMPNTPALVGAGISALYATPEVGAQDRALAERVLAAAGATLWVDREDLLDAVTAVSGSGPAYVFYFMEAMLQAGRELGLDAPTARQLTLETFRGAALLAAESGEELGILRERVTSRGGTTARALACLGEDAVAQHVVRAVRAACERARELGEEFGRQG